MSRAEVEGYLRAALELRDVCRRVIANVMASGFEVDAKSDESLVTTADIEAERAFRGQVERRFPGAGIVGEEFGESRPGADQQWIIDPVDGTAEFARGIPIWGTIIALWHGGEPLVAVVDHPNLGRSAHAAHGLGAFLDGRRLALDDLSEPPGRGARLGTPSRFAFIRHGEEGHVYDALVARHPSCRSYHTCFAHTCAATGALDAALEWRAPMWDIAAARLLAEEAGGAYECLHEVAQPGVGTVRSVVFGRPRMVRAVATTVREALAGVT